MPVVLTGCSAGWPAADRWDGMREMLGRFGDDVFWMTDVSIPEDSSIQLSRKEKNKHTQEKKLFVEVAS